MNEPVHEGTYLGPPFLSLKVERVFHSFISFVLFEILLSLNISEFLFISIFYSLKGEIKAKFLEQLSIESHHYLRVKNSVRRSKKISAEKLVKHWNWHQAIFDTLEKNIANLKTISRKF